MTVQFVDQTLRDGQQSWWGMRMRLGMALPIAPDIDQVGYHAVDVAGSSLFEVQTKYCQEDPWEYIRSVNAALPRIRDFRGLPTKAFDGRGNYSLGVREQLIFPEIDYDKVERIRGMQINIITTARTDEEGKRLLELLGMPFARN